MGLEVWSCTEVRRVENPSIGEISVIDAGLPLAHLAGEPTEARNG
jgi:hypothetical protein